MQSDECHFTEGDGYIHSWYMSGYIQSYIQSRWLIYPSHPPKVFPSLSVIFPSRFSLPFIPTSSFQVATDLVSAPIDFFFFSRRVYKLI